MLAKRQQLSEVSDEAGVGLRLLAIMFMMPVVRGRSIVAVVVVVVVVEVIMIHVSILVLAELVQVTAGSAVAES